MRRLLSLSNDDSRLDLVFRMFSPTKRHTPSCAVRGERNNRDTVPFPVDANNREPNLVVLLPGHMQCLQDYWPLEKVNVRDEVVALIAGGIDSSGVCAPNYLQTSGCGCCLSHTSCSPSANSFRATRISTIFLF